MIEKSKALEKLYYDYSHLPLGGKKIRCPYWSSKQRILLSGPFKGKGTPSQVTLATVNAAEKTKTDLRKLSSDEIRKFMEHHRIGVDCSGFVYHLADAFDKEKGGEGIVGKITGVRGSWARRVNAYCLTNVKNSIQIEKVKDLQLGDFIRFEGGKHIAIILRIRRNEKGIPQEVFYAHSARLSAVTGVHLARFMVVNPGKGLDKQKFLEKTRRSYNYFSLAYKKTNADGIRRLRIWT